MLGHLGGTEAEALRWLLWGYALAGVPYAYLLLRWRRLPAGAPGLLWILGGALAGRLLLLTLPPILSEDVWRYVWEGAIQLQGFDPYQLAPSAPALDAVAADPWLAIVRAQVGHPQVPTIYPPLAQLLFAGLSWIWPHPLLFRAFFALCDVGVVLCLWRLLEDRHGDPRAAALYGFAPVALMESAVGGHLEAAAIALLCLALLAIAGGRWRFGGAALGASVATKLLPLIGLLHLARRRPAATLSALGSLLILSAPFLSSGRHLFGGLSAFGHRWRGNEGAFSLIAWPFERALGQQQAPVRLPGWLEAAGRALVGPSPTGAGPLWPDEASFAAAKAVTAGLLLLLIVHRLRRAQDLPAFLGPVLAGAFLLAPVLHPWYLLWVLPFCALAAGAPGAWTAGWRWPMLGWSLLVWIAYLPRPVFLETGVWTESPGWRMVEYVPVWLGLCWVLGRRLKRSMEPE